jgi:Ca2+-binding EF-hand superfamily protein
MEELNKFTIQDMIREIKAKIYERSASGGLRGLSKIFKAMDNNNNGKLDLDDFRWGLMDFGLQLTKEEAKQVLDHFDRDGNGQVDFNEFLGTLRGPLPESRKKIVRAAYDKLDVNHDGKVKLDDIANLYDVSRHPDILQGRKSAEQVFVEFMGLWDTQKRDSIVTFDEFCDYYADVSASVDSDDYFTAMMKSAWKL